MNEMSERIFEREPFYTMTGFECAFWLQDRLKKIGFDNQLVAVNDNLEDLAQAYLKLKKEADDRAALAEKVKNLKAGDLITIDGPVYLEGDETSFNYTPSGGKDYKVNRVKGGRVVFSFSYTTDKAYIVDVKPGLKPRGPERRNPNGECWYYRSEEDIKLLSAFEAKARATENAFTPNEDATARELAAKLRGVPQSEVKKIRLRSKDRRKN